MNITNRNDTISLDALRASIENSNSQEPLKVVNNIEDRISSISFGNFGNSNNNRGSFFFGQTKKSPLVENTNSEIITTPNSPYTKYISNLTTSNIDNSIISTNTYENISNVNASEHEVESFIGKAPYDVKIEDTQELRELIRQAEQYQHLPFEEKLNAVIDLALKAMRNAYAGQFSHDQNEAKLCNKIVHSGKTLGYALENKAGCCRYQSTLFFLLGAAAKLGTRHYLESACVNQDTNFHTCFNVVYNGNTSYCISLFKGSNIAGRTYLKSLDIYKNPVSQDVESPFFAYTVENIDGQDQLHRYVRQGQHFDTLPEHHKCI